MSDSQPLLCLHCGSVSRVANLCDRQTPPRNLPRRLREWMEVPTAERPEPTEWR